MANKVNIDYVIKVATQHKCNCWRIWDADNTQLDCRENPALELNTSLAALRDAWENIAGTYIKIRIAPRKIKRGGDQVTNVYTYDVKCNPDAEGDDDGDDDNIAAPVRTKFSAGEAGIYGILADLKVQLAEQKKDAEIKDLRREIDELKSGTGKGKSKVLERFLEKMLLEGDKKEVAPIAGTTAAETTTTTTTAPAAEKKPAAAAAPVGDAKAAQTRLVNALNKLKKVDAEFIITLEKIAAKAEAEPETYKTYKAML